MGRRAPNRNAAQKAAAAKAGEMPAAKVQPGEGKKTKAKAVFRERVKAAHAKKQAFKKPQLLAEGKVKQKRDVQRQEDEAKASSTVKVKRSQLEKAVKALVQLVAKKSANTNPLFAANSETMQAVFSLSRVPEKRENKGVLIPLPHPMFDDKSEVCFISKDPQKEFKELLMQKHPTPGLTKVLGLDKLRRNFKTGEQKRALADAYDLFLCDSRIIEMMPSLLGTIFYDKKKKRPVPVKLVAHEPTANIKKAIASTTLRVPQGPSFGVKFGRCSMDEKELVENAAKVIAETVRHLCTNPIQSISIQATESVALPIWKRPLPPGERLDLKKYHSDSGSSVPSQSGDTSAPVSDAETGSILPSGTEDLSELETEGESVSMLETAGESLSELDSEAGDVDNVEVEMPLKKSLGKRKHGASSPNTAPTTSPKATLKSSPKTADKSADMLPPKKKAKKGKA